MKLFKDFKTKKQLRQENETLRRKVDSLTYRPPIVRTERPVRKICVKQLITDPSAPEDYIKSLLRADLIRELNPHIEYDSYDTSSGGKVYSGSLHVVTRGD